MTTTEFKERLSYFKAWKANIDKQMEELQKNAMVVKMEQGKFDDEFNKFMSEITGKEDGQVHVTEIMEKILDLPTIIV